jgi:hypothetical protein
VLPHQNLGLKGNVGIALHFGYRTKKGGAYIEKIGDAETQKMKIGYQRRVSILKHDYDPLYNMQKQICPKQITGIEKMHIIRQKFPAESKSKPERRHPWRTEI